MTLKEAFNQWSVAPRNSVLANRSRDAVNKVLLKEYGDTDLELIDETFAREIFLGSDVAQELKTKAASILVYVLQWGGDHGHCDRPSFDFSVAREPEVKPADKPKGRKKPQITQKDTEEKIDTESLTPNPSPTGEGNAAAQDICDTQKSPCESVSSVAKEESVAKPKRIIRKVDDDICQLDLRTLEVIKRWPHALRIKQELGIHNVVRAIERCGLAGGFYWSYAKDLDTFAKRLAAHKEHNAEVHKNHCAQMRAAKEPQIAQKAASKREESEARIDSHEREQARPQGKDTEEKINTEQKPSVKPKASKKPAAVCDNKKSPCESVSSVATPSLRGRAGEGLSGFTDDELFAELDRRGWLCVFTRTEIVTIGANNPAQDKNRKKVTMF